MPEQFEKDNIAILTGNGFSVAYTRKLLLKNITNDIHDRFKAESDQVAVDALTRLSTAVDLGKKTSSRDFEALVGALEDLEQYLELLNPLRSIDTNQSSQDLGGALDAVQSFVRRLYSIGVSHVLESIYTNSTTTKQELEPFVELIQEIFKRFHGTVAFGNLNYDTILLSALLKAKGNSKYREDLDYFQVSDFAHPGWTDYEMANGVVDDEIKEKFLPLRSSEEDFEKSLERYRGQLLHLHGSIQFWKHNDQKILAKTRRKDDTLTDDWWRKLRDQTGEWSPLVVLANSRNKDSHVSEEPFRLAYDTFRKRLETAHHWMLIGYSFRDSAINNMLSNAFLKHKTEYDAPPRILISTRGDDISKVRFLELLGYDNPDSDLSWLSIHRDGVRELRASKEWKQFSR